MVKVNLLPQQRPIKADRHAAAGTGETASLAKTNGRNHECFLIDAPFTQPLLRLRCPGQLFNLDLDRAFGDVSVGASLHAQDSTYDDLANQDELAGFATLDLRGEYRPNREWRLQSRVANLFDADYQTVDGYNQPGQAVYFSVRYQAL